MTKNHLVFRVGDRCSGPAPRSSLKKNIKNPSTKPRKSDRDRGLKLRNWTLKFGAWNVHGCRNKMEEIIKEINIMKMDVVILIATKRREREVKHWEIVYTFSAG